MDAKTVKTGDKVNFATRSGIFVTGAVIEVIGDSWKLCWPKREPEYINIEMVKSVTVLP